MSILRPKSSDIVKDNYRICIDLDTLCNIRKFEDNKLVFYPCRLKAVNELYKKPLSKREFERLSLLYILKI